MKKMETKPEQKTQPQLSPRAGGEMGGGAARSQPGETKLGFKIAFSGGARKGQGNSNSASPRSCWAASTQQGMVPLPSAPEPAGRPRVGGLH